MAVCLGPHGHHRGGVLGLAMVGHAGAEGQGHARRPPQGQQPSLAQDGSHLQWGKGAATAAAIPGVASSRSPATPLCGCHLCD